MTNQRTAELRTCASCEWVFRLLSSTDGDGCPKCGFAHYGARYVYGDKCYQYAKTQKPWVDKKMCEYRYELQKQVGGSDEKGHV